MFKFIDEVAIRIIRPKRFYYKVIELYAENIPMKRTDFSVLNSYNQLLECSLFSTCPFK